MSPIIVSAGDLNEILLDSSPARSNQEMGLFRRPDSLE